MIERRLLTEAVLTALQTSGKPVGLCDTPADSGWSGQPNLPTSSFRPYAVLVPGPANISEGSLSTNQTDWRLPYVITSYSVTPGGVEYLADTLRGIAHAELAKTDITLEVEYRCQQVFVAALGAVTRYEITQPPYYGQTDTIIVWLSRKEPA